MGHELDPSLPDGSQCAAAGVIQMYRRAQHRHTAAAQPQHRKTDYQRCNVIFDNISSRHFSSAILLHDDFVTVIVYCRLVIVSFRHGKKGR